MARITVTKESHSNFEVLGEGDKLLEIRREQPCYAVLRSGWQGMERLKLWFHNREGQHREVTNWLLNDDTLWGEAFITKDYDEGIEDGFEVNIHLPTNFLFSAFAAIRMPWESEFYGWGDPGWDWGKFRKLGFSEKASYFLATQFLFGKKGELRGSSYNSNHIPIPRNVHLKDYHIDNFKKQKGLMYDRAACEGVSDSWIRRSGEFGFQILKEGMYGDRVPQQWDEVKEKVMAYVAEQEGNN